MVDMSNRRDSKGQFMKGHKTNVGRIPWNKNTKGISFGGFQKGHAKSEK